MKIEYDKKADAVYITINDAPYAYGKDLDNERRIDYTADGNVKGIEITCVSAGVNLDDLPYKEQVASLLKNKNIKIYA